MPPDVPYLLAQREILRKEAVALRAALDSLERARKRVTLPAVSRAYDEQKRAVERSLVSVDHHLSMVDQSIAELSGLLTVPTRGNMGHTMLGQEPDSRALKISKTKTAGGKKRAPEVEALHAAGLTPNDAAEIITKSVGRKISRDSLKQRWAKGDQLRAMPEAWADILAQRGVPKTTWRKLG